MSKILLIDDDIDYLGILQNFLKSKGYEVNALDGWSHATDAIRDFKPNLIVLDVFLGGFDGLSACKKLKSNSYTRHIPVLIISGYPKIEETAIKEFGAEAFMAKPFSIHDLDRKIHDIINRNDSDA